MNIFKFKGKEKLTNKQLRQHWVGKTFVGTLVTEVAWGRTNGFDYSVPAKTTPLSGIVENVSENSVKIGGTWYPLGNKVGMADMHEIVE